MKSLNLKLKKLKIKLEKSLRSKSGETIMEALVSMLILGILLTTVVSTIRFSLGVTGDSLRDADASQLISNDLSTGNLTGGTQITVEFKYNNPTLNMAINTTHDALYKEEDGIVAFRP